MLPFFVQQKGYESIQRAMKVAITKLRELLERIPILSILGLRIYLKISTWCYTEPDPTRKPVPGWHKDFTKEATKKCT